MKLSRVTLDVAHRLPGMDMEKHELTEDDCPSMRYDAETHSLVFGAAPAASGIGWVHVIKWERSDVELVCDWCQKTFASGQALGGHRRNCKEKKAAE